MGAVKASIRIRPAWRCLALGLAACAWLAVAAPRASAADTTTRASRATVGVAAKRAKGLRAVIRRTRYGVPHIKAQSFRGLGFGYAYAFAQDNICTIADSYVTVAGERSRYFGPDGSWTFSGNGATYNNLDSDFFYGKINDSGIVEDLASRPPPEGPIPKLKAVVRGYVAGYNTYLRRKGVNHLPDARCRGADWVRRIKAIDVYRRFHQLGSLATAGAAIDGIAQAAPVLGLQQADAAEQRQARALKRLKEGDVDGFFPLESGSNAYGLGGDATSGPWRGLVLGNPHFPWDGAERLYQAQLTIPGKLNVSGGSLYGVPAVLIGNTRGLAWSHTVASAWRFTPFELTLVPGNPHAYLVDGQIHQMQATTVTVKVREADGSLGERTRTLYDTEYGPMLTSILGLPLFPWTPLKAFALGDANYENFRYLNHFLRTDMAQSVREYDRIERQYQGIPWVNSIAADRKGHAYYSMDGAIPNVPDSKATSCAGVLGLVTFPLLGLPVLDGARSACNWDVDADAVVDGIFGPAAIPRLFRDDYVHNANDSHWLSNPEQPLEGFERVIGDERTQRSLRTRLGLIMVQERLAGTDGLPGRGFTLRRLADVALGNRQYAGELWRGELLGVCQANATLVAQGACSALAAWDLHDDLDSPGAILFRRFASNLLGNFEFVPSGTDGGQYVGADVIWDVPFSPGDPVNTPRGLNTLNPLVSAALTDAVSDLEGAGIPLDGTLRDFQSDVRGGRRIPIHGGPGSLGVFNAINVDWDPSAGYPNVPHGSSFIAAMGFRKAKRKGRRRCPVRALTFVTYGESENQRSRHAGDYTRAFSRKHWNRVPFCEAEIRRDPKLKVKRVSRRR
jgi:acyl-homoserine-lactone acylase